MKVLGNIIWLVFGGVEIALEYIVGSVALMVTIIGIPFGLQSIKLALLTRSPQGVAWVSEQCDECRLVFRGWSVDMAHPYVLRRAVLHHHHRHSFWETTFQVGSYRLDAVWP